MKRRILSLIMVVMLLLPAAFSMAATTPVTITSDDIQGSVGDTVTVAINMVVEPPKLGQTMDSIQFVLEYDSGESGDGIAHHRDIGKAVLQRGNICILDHDFLAAEHVAAPVRYREAALWTVSQ